MITSSADLKSVEIPYLQSLTYQKHPLIPSCHGVGCRGKSGKTLGQSLNSLKGLKYTSRKKVHPLWSLI
jgi:hypothetical protein